MQEKIDDINRQLIKAEIQTLPVTETFMLRSKLMGFKTLSDILKAALKILSSHVDYSERWYFELINLLERKGLLYLLREN